MNEPVAWAYIKDGEFFDAIHPDEHDKYEGMYKTPLYTHPVKELTDEEIKDVYFNTFNWNFSESASSPFLDFARAILRKAQEK